VAELEVLVGELLAVDGLATSALQNRPVSSGVRERVERMRIDLRCHG
jgi:hypothetical protein